jgi:hypothetical protein
MTIQDEFSRVPSRHMRRFFRLKRDGVCVGCAKKPPVEGKLKCQDCIDYKTEHYKENQEAEIESEKHYTPRPSKYLPFLTTK